VGKTDLAISLAMEFHTEIVSADSRQFYREMNIGTAKPTVSQLALVKHHLIDSHSIKEDYNAGRFETDALECLLGIFSTNEFAILCGGSGLYVDLVCSGADELPARNPVLREQLNAVYKEKGIEVLQEKLKTLDPDFYKVIDLKNPHRLIRAIEVCMESGKKYSEMRSQKKSKRPFRIVKIGLEDEREKVYQRINERVDFMMNNHLLDEVKLLYPMRHLNALQAVGYSELFSFLDGQITIEEAVTMIKQHTRNFAKRQWTWFKKDKEIKWFRPGETQSVIEYISSKTE
jgi:tRNA dimethylallyltransferase